MVHVVGSLLPGLSSSTLVLTPIQPWLLESEAAYLSLCLAVFKIISRNKKKKKKTSAKDQTWKHVKQQKANMVREQMRSVIAQGQIMEGFGNHGKHFKTRF